MSASPTNLNMNWDGVTVAYTPTGGALTTIAVGEVVDIEIDGKSMQETFYGDNRRFPRLIRNTAKTRSIKVVGGNVAALLSVPEDVECTVTAYLNDAVNGRGPGCIKIVAVRALREGSPFKGQNNKFATGDLKFNCAGVVAGDSTDDADPFTITVVPGT